MSGDLDALGPDADSEADEEFLTEVLDLCVGCKGCSRDCPSEVDLAKLKAELTHQHHQRHGASLRDRIFANVGTLARLGSATAPVSNWLPRLPGAGWLSERLFGIASERDLPAFRRHTLEDWMAERDPGAGVARADADRTALLVPDVYTNYSHPEVGRAAVRLLEAAGVHVELADVRDSGRPAFSKGFLDRARERARENVDELAPQIEDGWDVVVVEPSDAVMVQSDYRDLLTGADVDRVAANTYGVAEYLDAFDLPVPDAPAEPVTYHGHCHQQSTGRAEHAVRALDRAGYDVDALDSTCCGMAGSFGYEAEHYSLSTAISDILFDQVEASEGTVAAPGTSCRAQLDHGGVEARHPVELLADPLDGE